MSKATSALAPVVSDEIQIDTTTPEYEGGAWQTEVVCGETRCATFFEIDRTEEHLYMVPGAGTERPIDLGPFPFTNVLGSLLILPRPNDEFLILGMQANGDDLEPFARRIRGSDGKDLGSVPAAFELSSKLDLHANGDSILAIDRDANGYLAQVFDASTFEPRGAAAPIAYTVPDDWGPPPEVVAGDESFLVVWKGNAQRVSTTTGAVLDKPPLKPSKFSSGPTAGAYRDGVFYLSWVEIRGVVMSRIRESDGASLDPDDDFNEISGAQSVCTGTCPSGARLEPVSVSALGDDIVVTWSTEPSSTHFLTQAIVVDPTTGSRASGDANDPATTLLETEPSRGEPRRCVFHSSGAVVLEDNYANYLSLDLEPLGATVEDAILLGRGRVVPDPPSVARAGGTYLVTWRDNWGHVQAARVNDAGHLIEPPFPVDTFVDTLSGTPSFTVVSSNGTDFLVAWTDGYYVNRRIVHPNGDMEAPIQLVPPSGWIPLNVQLVANSDYFFLTYKLLGGVYALRLEPDGTAVEEPVYLGEGSNHVTLADWTPTSDKRTFVVVLSDGTVRRFRSQSGSVLSATSGVCATRGASDGERLFAACGDGSGFLLDPISGTKVSGSETIFQTATGTSGGHVNHIWHDGRSFNVLFDRPYEGFDSHFTLRRYDETLTELDADVGGYGHFVSTVGYYDHVAAAAGENGSSLLAYQTFDHSLFGTVLKARIVTNDGLVAPPSDGDRDPDNGPGVGGAGGEPGVGGTSTTGGTGGTGNGGVPAAGGVSGTEGAEGGAGALDGGTSSSGRGGVDGTGGTATGSGGDAARAGDTSEGGENASGGTSGASAGGAARAGRGNAGSPTGSGGANGNGSGHSKGCGCSVPASSSGHGALLLGALSLGLLVRRRRNAAYA